MVTFTVDGEPQGKARARYSSKSSSFYTPEDTVSYEELIATRYKESDKGKYFGKSPMVLGLVAYYGIAKSHSKKKKALMLSGEIRPTKKPDLDNILKVVKDALNKVAYHDDSQIVSIIRLEKFYSDNPRLEIELSEL